jgi:hypothetical protein
MEVVMSIENAEDDEAFLRSLIRPEEDRRLLHPELPWQGGYRWFRSANVIPMERYRERRATLLGRSAVGGPV